MDDFLYDSTNVAITLSEIEWAKARRVFVEMGVGLELYPLGIRSGYKMIIINY